MDKVALQEFMQSQPLAVISTVSPEGRPEAAVIAFACTPGLELVFHTRTTSRKYQNFTANARVAFVIGWDQRITVQYEGSVSALEDDKDAAAKELYLQKNPFVRHFQSQPGIAFFKVSPAWIRQTDINVQPWKIQEMTV